MILSEKKKVRTYEHCQTALSCFGDIKGVVDGEGSSSGMVQLSGVCAL